MISVSGPVNAENSRAPNDVAFSYHNDWFSRTSSCSLISEVAGIWFCWTSNVIVKNVGRTAMSIFLLWLSWLPDTRCDFGYHDRRLSVLNEFVYIGGVHTNLGGRLSSKWDGTRTARVIDRAYFHIRLGEVVGVYLASNCTTVERCQRSELTLTSNLPPL